MKSLARRLLRAFYAARMHRRSQGLVLSPAGPTLVIAPHPDDEALGCGALLARLSASGANLHIAYFTSGEGSHPGHPQIGPAELAAIRQAEARRAMAEIGVPESRIRFCGAPDGRLKDLSPGESAVWVTRLRDLLAEIKPAEVMLPCRDDGSSEHEAVFALLRRALRDLPVAAPRVLEFPVWSWWSPRHLSRVSRRAGFVWRQPVGTFAQKKRSLVMAYPSQTEATPPFTSPVLSRQFVDAFDFADEFFLESPIGQIEPGATR